MNMKKEISVKIAECIDIIRHRGNGKQFQIGNSLKQEPKDCKVFRQLPMPIKGNIPIRRSLALKSHYKDYYIDALLRKNKYSFRGMKCILNPYGNAPLTMLAVFWTKKEYRVRFLVKGHRKEEDVSDETKTCCFHKVPVYGLYPDELNHISFQLLDEDGNVVDTKKISIKTDPLPDYMQNLCYDVANTTDTALPLILMTGSGEALPCVVDVNGNVRYYFIRKTSVYGIFPLKNGLFLYGDMGICTPTFAHQHVVMLHEMDYLGRTHNTFVVQKGLHHFVTELPNGNLIGITNTMENHSEDAVVELDRKTGRIVKTIKMIDILGSKYADMTDWVHPNCVQYFEETDQLQICLRNVHSILRIQYTTEEIVWILADPAVWKGTPLESKVLSPVGEVRWHYQAHAAKQLELVQGKTDDLLYIMIFDNHRINRRPIESFDGAEESFVLVYGVDEQAKTVQMIREFVTPQSLIRSNAVYDYSKNRMFAMAGVIPVDADSERRYGQILEFDFATGKRLNEKKVLRDFFSAVPFVPGMETMAADIAVDNDYMKGEAAAFSLVEKLDGIEGFSGDKLILNSFIVEDLLYVKWVDHSFDRLYLAGSERAYVKDYTDTYQTMERFENSMYYVLLSLRNIEKGTYCLVTEKDGICYRSDRVIEIK